MAGKRIGVDLGTATTIIYVAGRGIVLSEPSAAAFRVKTGKVTAVGQKAYDMLCRNPSSISVVCPMREGVVKDFTAMRKMLTVFLKRALGRSVLRPTVIVCVPSSVTGLEKRTLLEIVTSAGAGRACLIEEPLAAAIGAGCEITDARGTMIVDIGGGTTDIAVITMGSVAVSKSIPVAGNNFDEGIIRMLRMERNVVIGEKTAEYIKRSIGCAQLREAELGLTIKGKNYITGLPETTEIDSTDTYLCMREHIEAIIEGIRSVLEISPPELVGDIDVGGIVLTGGGSLLKDLPAAITERTGIRTRLANDPVNCVAKGIGLALEDVDMLSERGYIFKTREEIMGYAES